MEEFTFNTVDNTLLCILKGRFGADTTGSFSDRLTAKIIECRKSMDDPALLKVCFDLNNTVFISSSFIRICIMVSRTVSPGHFSIINAIPMIKKTFKIAGLDVVLKVS